MELVRETPNWSRMGTTKQMALSETMHKVARIGHGDHEHLDHWNDISGYGELGANACTGGASATKPTKRKVKPAKKAAKKRVVKKAAIRRAIPIARAARPARVAATPSRAPRVRNRRPNPQAQAAATAAE
jgi:hypothetical protein